ncbi:DUF3742 family protein [Burkholderia pseudomallei]|nr:DUF3742 family protein [Burkholderia pseudomallei]MBO7795479.1 DUF3742 family protein [Burkholderia pseudomallei]MBO7814032.1 DUF3742 family protein [Burkholderia pseudomallei]
MTTTSRPSGAHRFGEWAGHTWRWLARQDRRALAWLSSLGLSASTAKAASWAVKLLVLGVLLYVAFWLMLVVMLVFAAAWLAGHSDHDSAQGEWRNGQEGYGYYENGTRTDYGRLFDDD